MVKKSERVATPDDGEKDHIVLLYRQMEALAKSVEDQIGALKEQAKADRIEAKRLVDELRLEMQRWKENDRLSVTRTQVLRIMKGEKSDG